MKDVYWNSIGRKPYWLEVRTVTQDGHHRCFGAGQIRKMIEINMMEPTYW